MVAREYDGEPVELFGVLSCVLELKYIYGVNVQLQDLYQESPAKHAIN